MAYKTIDERVVALEGDVAKLKGVLHDRVVIDEGAAGTTEEGEAIARVRERCDNEWIVTVHVHDARHVLAALDRATAERDAHEKAHNYVCGELEKNDKAMEKGLARIIRDLEAQLADARSECTALRATEENLRAQLAARTDATPLGWVNVYGDRVIDVYFHHSEKAARNNAAGSDKVKRVAVPVYEHAPRPVAPSVVTDAEIVDAVNAAGLWMARPAVLHKSSFAEHYIAALRPLFDRAAASAPAMQVVGACVVDVPDRAPGATAKTFHWVSEHLDGQEAMERECIEYAAKRGGIPKRLYAGERIGGGE